MKPAVQCPPIQQVVKAASQDSLDAHSQLESILQPVQEFVRELTHILLEKSKNQRVKYHQKRSTGLAGIPTHHLFFQLQAEFGDLEVRSVEGKKMAICYQAEKCRRVLLPPPLHSW